MDEWWRDPIRRHYWRIVLEGGAQIDVYEDKVEVAWYEQRGGE